MYIEIFKSTAPLNNQWYWHFKSKNHQIVAVSEGFPSKSNAVRAAKACVRMVVKELDGLRSLTFDPLIGQKTKASYTLTWY